MGWVDQRRAGGLGSESARGATVRTQRPRTRAPPCTEARRCWAPAEQSRGRAACGPPARYARPVHARAQTLHVRCGGGTRPEASGGSGRYGQTCTERVTGAQGAPGESSVMLVTSRVREDRHAGVTRAAPGEAEYARGEPGRVGVVSQGHTTRAAPRRSTYMTRGDIYRTAKRARALGASRLLRARSSCGGPDPPTHARSMH